MVTTTGVGATVGGGSSSQLGPAHSAIRNGTEPLATRQTPSQFQFDVAVLGLGTDGLPAMLDFHAAGRSVLGVDPDQGRIAAIRSRDASIASEPRRRLAIALADGARCAVSEKIESIRDAAAIVICAPAGADRPGAGLTGACQDAVAHVRAGQVVIATTVTHVGRTRELLVEPLAARGLRAGRDVFAAFSPGAVDRGDQDGRESWPRLIGGATGACVCRAAALLAGFASSLRVVTAIEVAELATLYENAVLAANVALAEEFSTIGSTFDLDVLEVISAGTRSILDAPVYPLGKAFDDRNGCDLGHLLHQLREKHVNAPLLAVLSARGPLRS